MSVATLRRLRARGELVIRANRDGYSVMWWPPGQKGNPFCARGDSGTDLGSILAKLELETRPRWYPDVESVRHAREEHAERERQSRQQALFRSLDLDDRRREKWSRESEEHRLRRERTKRQEERRRVRKALTGDWREL